MRFFLSYGLVHASPFVHVRDPLERVFSLLKLYFGDARDSALADMLQATLMLIYNKRATGHAS